MTEAAAAEEEENYTEAKPHLPLPPPKNREQLPWFISHLHPPPPPYQHPSSSNSTTFMDLDFTDLDASWPFDQIHSTSPVLVSTSDQPFSPLWTFADGVNVSIDRHPPAAAFRISADFNRFSHCNPEPAVQKIEEEEDNDDNKKKHPTPFLGFTPLEDLDVSCIIKERMTQALRYFKESTEQHQILAQVWAPVKSGNRFVLTTSGQPFVLGPHSNGLNQYRTVSQMYMFAVDEEIDGPLGLPGRVFRQKLPEWTPNVQYYTSKEYSRVNHARNFNVKGTLALPVFEPSGQSCVGVLELIMTSQKINYAPEVDKVCKALELFCRQ